MTVNDDKENTPWWEAELPRIKGELSVYLRRRVPTLRHEHEDLLGDALLSLSNHVIKNSEILPQSWFSDSTPDADDQSYLHRLANTILKRRIADSFRKSLTSQTISLEEDVYDSGLVGQERRIIMDRVLEVVLSALDEMPAEDRDLIALISQEVVPRKAVDTRDRQRLHRIRKRLKERIKLRVGCDVSDLLKTTD